MEKNHHDYIEYRDGPRKVHENVSSCCSRMNELPNCELMERPSSQVLSCGLHMDYFSRLNRLKRL
jgi:hypothetical protein